MFELEIRAALKKAGLPETMWEQVKVTSAGEIDAAVTALKATAKPQTEEEFLAFVKASGNEDLYNSLLAKNADKRVTEAIKTHDAKKTTKPPDAPPPTPETDANKAILDEMKTLREEFATQKAKLDRAEIDAGVKAALKAANISEEFAPHIHVESADQIAASVAAFAAKVTAQAQAVIDTKLESGALSPAKVGSGTPAETASVAEYAANLGKGGMDTSAPFGGRVAAEAAASK
jgi:hypothetical protein